MSVATNGGAALRGPALVAIAAAFAAGVGLSAVLLRPELMPHTRNVSAAPEPAPTPLTVTESSPADIVSVSLPPDVGAPFGALPRKTAESPAPEAQRLAGDQLAAFNEASGYYRKGLFLQGDAAAERVTDTLARTALNWVALRVTPTQARLDAFVAAHPHWPLADWLQAVREGWLYSGKPAPAETIAALKGGAAVTPQGAIALARAYILTGRSADAEAAIRALWRDGDLDNGVETTLTHEFGGMLRREDHLARADRLLYAERWAPAWRAATLAGPDAVALAQARIEASKGPLSARSIAAVTPAFRNTSGFLFAHVQDARRSGRLAEADAFLELAPKDAASLVDPDKWWTERRMIARLWLDRGDAAKAYEVASQGVARSSPSRVDAAFHAGWIALRFLNDPTRAAQHFADAAAAAETPLSIARANYWRGRAAEALGREDDAHGYYARAATYPIAYYGQLAARKLGATDVTLRPTQTAAAGEARDEATRVVELYLQTGLDDFVAPVAYAAARTWTDGSQLAALSDTLRRRGSAALNVTFGKLATERGFALDATAFPTFGLPQFEPLAGSADLGQVMAVARQESEFLIRAASGAGAKGLMQILPGTAADTARKAGVPYDYGRLIGDPRYNLQLGAAYLGQLVAAEGGSMEMALAAYNAGAGRVQQWVAAYGDPRAGGDLVDWVERIPYDETRDYVQRVMENYAVYKARLAETPDPRTLANALVAR